MDPEEEVKLYEERVVSEDITAGVRVVRYNTTFFTIIHTIISIQIIGFGSFA